MEAKKPARRYPWKTPLIVIVTAFLVMVTGLWVYDNLGAADLARAVKFARALPGPLTYTELEAARRSWSDAENGANVILSIRPSLEQIQGRKDPELLKRVPLLGDTPDIPLGHRWSEQGKAAVRNVLERYRSELVAIDRLKDFEGGRFPIDFLDNPIQTLLPHLRLLRTSARLKAVQTVDRAMNGDVSRLANDVQIMLRLGGLIEDEPTLISNLVGVAITSLAVDTIGRVCAVQEVPAAQLEQIEKLLAPLDDYSKRMDWGLRGERAFFMGAADYGRKHGLNALGAGAAPPALSKVPGAQGLLMRNEGEGLRALTTVIRANSEGKALEAAANLDTAIGRASPMQFFTNMLMPSLKRAVELNMKLTAEIRAAHVALAAERYRQTSGAFPATLDALIPKYIDRIPMDPFKPDQPLKLHMDDAHFIVYSIGEDGQDNGGDVIVQKRGLVPADSGFALLAPTTRNQPPLPDQDLTWEERQKAATQSSESE